MAEVDGEYFDSDKASARVSAMWLALAEQIAGALPEMVLNGDAKDAIQCATFAEACFWKATGESDTHDIKDVLPRSPQDTKND